MIIEISHSADALDAHALAPVIRTLGKALFGDTLLEAVSASVGAELFTAFSIDESGQPTYRVARAVDALGNLFAERAAQRYVEGYWHNDPALGQLMRAQQHCGTAVLCQQAWDQIPHSRYRAFCYEGPRLVDRISILAAQGHRRMIFSAYRRATRGPFALDEVRQFATHAETLLALVDRHVELLDQGAAPPLRGTVALIEERLASAFTALSRRERQVCAGLLAGMAAKEIALFCDVEASSIVTYKKRAFEKLGVANRRALQNLWSATVAHQSH